MSQTETKHADKAAIIKYLLEDKEKTYRGLMDMQMADLGEAEKEADDEQNMIEQGKIDQSINRVEARASSVEALRAEIALLRNLKTIDPTPEVQLADIVETDQGNFFVAVPAAEFEVQGVKYRGISTDSPLFQALTGKQDGDKVEVNGTSFHLLGSH